MSSLNKEFDSVVSNIKFCSKIEQQYFESRLLKFINNDSNDKNKLEILNIVSKINWYQSKEINDYIVKKAKKIIDEETAIYQIKDKATSSSNCMISFISNEGICGDEQVLNYDDIVNSGKLKFFSKLLIIDDYIGSGSTILEKLVEISKFLTNQKIIILSCICQNCAVSKLKQNSELDITIYSKYYLDSYKEYLELSTQDYVSKICELCGDKNIQYGWGNCGALVSINSKSPNNNISMLWNNTIKYNGNKWLPLLSREYCFEKWNQKNKNLIHKNIMILKKYYNEKFKNKYYNITYEEFEFLIFSYSCYLTPNELIENKYFQNNNEFHNFIDNLLKSKLIKLKNNYIIISNRNLYSEINKITQELYREQNKFKKNITSTIDV